MVDARSGRQDCPEGKHPEGKHPGGEHCEIKGNFESAEYFLEFQQHVDAFEYTASQKENVSQGLAMPAAYDRTGPSSEASTLRCGSGKRLSKS